MSLSQTPQLVKAGLVQLDATQGRIQRSIALQYNPDSLQRSYEVQGSGGEGGGERAQPFRLKGPAIETLRLEAEVDATDALADPDRYPEVARHGIAPQLAALEGLVHPDSQSLQRLGALARSGTLEILPPEAPLVLFIWGANRVAPVRVSELSITEEAFDARLNPLRARVSLGLRVLSTDDLGFAGRGGALFLQHLHRRESLATMSGEADLARFGLSGLP